MSKRQSRPKKADVVCAVMLMTLLLAIAGRAQSPATTQATSLYDRVSPSLVIVQYTFDGELGRRELTFGGIVVSTDGLIVSSILTTPVQLPDEQLKDFKIILPGDAETELEADFLGRDERTNLALFKAREKHDWTPLKFEEAPLTVGDSLFSVGLLGKDSGYKSCLSTSIVSALLRGPVPQVLVSGSLGPIDSPAFDAQGHAVGMVFFADRSAFLNDPRGNSLTAELSRTFVPTRDFELSFSDPPSKDHPLKLPHLGIASLTGLKKDVAEYYGLKNQPAVQVGDVFPNFPADKAGLKSGDVITQVNGQSLERGDEPEETPLIMTRKIQRMHVGDKVKLTILRGKNSSQQVTVTLGERPMQANRAERFYAEDLGFAARQLVLEDRYARKMPLDATGVIVALIRPDSAAASDKLGSGDVIKKLNQNDVTDLPGFKKDYAAFRKERPHEPVVMEVLRGPNTQIVRIDPPQ